MLKIRQKQLKAGNAAGKKSLQDGDGDGAGLRRAQGCNAPSGITSHNGVRGCRTHTFHCHDAVEHVESLGLPGEW